MLKSKIKISTFIIGLIGGAGAAMCGIYIVLNGNLASLIFGLPFLLLGAYSVYSALNFDVLIVTPNELIINSLFGKPKKVITLKKFKSYSAIEKENATLKNKLSHMEWEDLVLFGDDIRFKISSSSYINYSELKLALIKGLKRNKESENKWEAKNSMQWGYGLVILGLILGLILFRNGFSEAHLGSSIGLIFITLIPVVAGVYLIKEYKKTSR
ncbi:hypothetical protein ACMA1I_19260 [Pontibacter sp. 13R65]|uniref:hypothetical protein n=1 Tax=Pontibacter sp. 13R65 TaxID=3127458 RepID=UPI00301C665E